MTSKSRIETSLDAERLPYIVLGTCVLVAAVLFLLDYHVNYGRWTQIGALRRMFNTTREDSLASWFGVTQTLFVALTVWALYWFSQGASKWRRRGWLVLALFFTTRLFTRGRFVDAAGKSVRAAGMLWYYTPGTGWGG